MNTHCTPFATALAALLTLSAANAAVPLEWTARPGQPAPVTFDRYHGETLAFRCTFAGFGEPPFPPAADIRLYYQTNGMGSSWWSVPTTVSSNVLSATWSPELDPGAERVALFFGAPSNAYAAAVLRLRHSPGFTPATPPPPSAFAESDPVFSAWLTSFTRFDPAADAWTVSGAIDLRLAKERDGYYTGIHGGDTYALLYTYHAWTFGTARDNATVDGLPTSTNLSFAIGGSSYTLEKGEWKTDRLATLSDIPETSLEPSTNYTARSISSFAATGTVSRATSYGTPTRWTDATGCVWEVWTDAWIDHETGNIFRNGTSIFPSDVADGEMSGYLMYDPNAMVYLGLEGEGWFYNGQATSSTPGTVFPGGPDATSLNYGRFTLGVTNLVGRVAMTNDIPSTNALPDTVARAVYDVHDLKWDEEEGILYWCRMAGGHDLCIAVTNVDLTHPTNAAALKVWREANR